MVDKSDGNVEVSSRRPRLAAAIAHLNSLTSRAAQRNSDLYALLRALGGDLPPSASADDAKDDGGLVQQLEAANEELSRQLLVTEACCQELYELIGRHDG